jgi:hypothetical protein
VNQGEHGPGPRDLSSFRHRVIRWTVDLCYRRLLTKMQRIVPSFSVFIFGFLSVASPVIAAPTFNRNVAPIFLGHCLTCHRPAGIASNIPFSSYREVRPWVRSIRQKLLSREMPPWPADPNSSVKFRNDARLSRRDIDTIVDWIDQGAPEGNAADLTPPPEFVNGWLHPEGLKPDLVVSLPGEFRAPPRGEIPYVRYLAKVSVPEDKWIAASQARPGNPALVHHMAITEMMLDPGMSPAELDPFESIARELGFRSGIPGARPAVAAPSNPAVFDMLGVFTPGATIEIYDDDSAKLLKGGKDLYLDFNIHYQATGKPESDRSMIGFWFRNKPPKHQLFRTPGATDTILANGKELLADTPGEKAEGTHVAIPPIPPFAQNFELVGVTGYTEPVTVYQFHPHAHLRAKDFRYTVVYPDGREKVVLSVPKYDFRWQLAYELETPLHLPAGSKLVVTAHYDNSRNNKFNPAPEKEVYFRSQNQSWDEMFTPFIQYSIDSQDLNQQAVPASLRVQAPIASLVQVVGCLEKDSAQTWLLKRASDPLRSETQFSTSVALKASKLKSLGTLQYQLLGVGFFNPIRFQQQKVAVTGLLVQQRSGSQINVTSLEPVEESCVPGGR